MVMLQPVLSAWKTVVFKGTTTKQNSAIRKSSPDEQCLFRVRGQNYSGNAHEDENNFLVSSFRVCKKRKKYEKNNGGKKVEHILTIIF